MPNQQDNLEPRHDEQDKLDLFEARLVELRIEEQLLRRLRTPITEIEDAGDAHLKDALAHLRKSHARSPAKFAKQADEPTRRTDILFDAIDGMLDWQGNLTGMRSMLEDSRLGARRLDKMRERIESWGAELSNAPWEPFFGAHKAIGEAVAKLESWAEQVDHNLKHNLDGRQLRVAERVKCAARLRELGFSDDDIAALFMLLGVQAPSDLRSAARAITKTK